MPDLNIIPNPIDFEPHLSALQVRMTSVVFNLLHFLPLFSRV